MKTEMLETMAATTWAMSFDKGPDSMYTAIVDHEKGFTPWNMTSDGTVIHLYYLEDPAAPEGTDTWDLGIRDMGIMPDHDVIVMVVLYMKNGDRILAHHDRPKVRDGSSVM